MLWINIIFDSVQESNENNELRFPESKELGDSKKGGNGDLVLEYHYHF